MDTHTVQRYLCFSDLRRFELDSDIDAGAAVLQAELCALEDSHGEFRASARARTFVIPAGLQRN